MSLASFGCADDPGNASCVNFTTQPALTKCLTTVSRCDDDRSYEVSCDSGKCTCLVDGKSSGSAKVSDCPVDLASLNRACGWTLAR
jgi:hypothetical protein